jgi:hypothetical protein
LSNLKKYVDYIFSNEVSNVVSSKFLDAVFKRIGFAIQKGLVAQLVARLSSIQV